MFRDVYIGVKTINKSQDDGRLLDGRAVAPLEKHGEIMGLTALSGWELYGLVIISYIKFSFLSVTSEFFCCY